MDSTFSVVVDVGGTFTDRIMLVEHAAGRFFYTMPDLGDGGKAAIHYEGQIVQADSVNRMIGSCCS